MRAADTAPDAAPEGTHAPGAQTEGAPPPASHHPPRDLPDLSRWWVVRNQTPERLRLACATLPIELAPLQTVRIDSDRRSWGEAAEQARAARALTWEGSRLSGVQRVRDGSEVLNTPPARVGALREVSRSRPLVFWFVPRCQRLCGSQK